MKSIVEDADLSVDDLLRMHPWEVDPGQPRVRQAGPSVRFKHYSNLAKTEGKLRKTVARFGGCCFVSCWE